VRFPSSFDQPTVRVITASIALMMALLDVPFANQPGAIPHA
jgi:hypothetical protein